MQRETMSDTSIDRAQQLCRIGLNKQARGDLKAAKRLFRQSLALHETAEAWCYLGWCRSLSGRLAQAVSHCRRAIAVDPEFGNAYNDLGAYLVELGHADDAVVWFERAKNASRYDTPQFPYLNLARVHIARARFSQALLELQAARVIAPMDQRIEELVAYVGLVMAQERKAA